MNGKIGPVADQIYEIWIIVEFLLFEYLEESPNCVYIPNIRR